MNHKNNTFEFKQLHKKGNPLVLYNIWDAGSAQAVAAAGAKAIATGSMSCAAAHGYQDGEEMPFSLLLQSVEGIKKTVNLPLSVDFETGYGVNKYDNLRKLLQVGVTGINFEDQLLCLSALNSINSQSRIIDALVKVADAEKIDLFINARTDIFLQQQDADKHPQLIAEAKKRLIAYQEAGADGFFVPGLNHTELIAELCDFSPLPVNIMINPQTVSIEQLGQLGVSRISFGPFPYFNLMENLKEQSATFYTSK